MLNFASMSHDPRPLLLLSAGEPAGIGPDIIATAAQHEHKDRLACIADPSVIDARAKSLNLDLKLTEYPEAAAVPIHKSGTLAVLPVATAQAVSPGHLDPRNASYVLKCLDKAIQLIREGAAQALVTGPVHKGNINDAGIAFSGHTEYLAERCDGRSAPIMLLAEENLRVALVTTHIPLRDVAEAISTEKVRYAIETVVRALQRHYNITHPRIAVCGLNPHAGENGHLGCEDDNVIAPAIRACSALDAEVIGPLPADTAFARPLRDTVDAYVSMYHDQGLPVIKALGFGRIVNITLGLPIVRTSVDHGTALSLAGSGRADCDSLLSALTVASQFLCARTR